MTIPPYSAGEVVDTTGAGDTFNRTLIAVLAMNKGLVKAVRMATITEGISVTRHGAAGSIPLKTEMMQKLIDVVC